VCAENEFTYLCLRRPSIRAQGLVPRMATAVPLLAASTVLTVSYLHVPDLTHHRQPRRETVGARSDFQATDEPQESTSRSSGPGSSSIHHPQRDAFLSDAPAPLARPRSPATPSTVTLRCSQPFVSATTSSSFIPGRGRLRFPFAFARHDGFPAFPFCRAGCGSRL
jgi:hypothetical protein